MVWNSACNVEDCGFLAKSDGGSAFKQFLAEIASQKLGGPPHRASDFFFSGLFRIRQARTKESVERNCKGTASAVPFGLQPLAALATEVTHSARPRARRPDSSQFDQQREPQSHLDNEQSCQKSPALALPARGSQSSSADPPPKASPSLRLAAAPASTEPIQPLLAERTARPGSHLQSDLHASRHDLRAGGMPSAIRAKGADLIPAPADRELQFHNGAAASSTQLPPPCFVRRPHPHAAAPTAPNCAAAACCVRCLVPHAAWDRSGRADCRSHLP